AATGRHPTETLGLTGGMRNEEERKEKCEIQKLRRKKSGYGLSLRIKKRVCASKIGGTFGEKESELLDCDRGI
ncbi:MAG: hypothetical protein AAF570_24820, partial [Bacteroidota bacterium]